MNEDNSLEVLEKEAPVVIKDIKSILLDIKSILAQARSPLRGKSDDEVRAGKDRGGNR